MDRTRTRTLLPWLAALLVVALGLLAPGTAAAHAGHGAHAAQAGDWAEAAAFAPSDGAALVVLMAESPAIAAAISLSADSVSQPCGGAGCCNAGHGCCSAIPVALPAAPFMPPAAPPGAVLAGLPPGIAAAALPEPPRPFR